MTQKWVGNNEEDRAVIRKNNLEEPGKVDYVTEDKDELVATLYWSRLEIKEEKVSNGVL